MVMLRVYCADFFNQLREQLTPFSGDEHVSPLKMEFLCIPILFQSKQSPCILLNEEKNYTANMYLYGKPEAKGTQRNCSCHL